MFGMGRFCFQFSTQLQNVVVDRTSARIALVSPHFVEKFIPGDHPSGILDQVRQSFELLTCESNWLSLAMGFHGGEVYRHFPKNK
jgi:hypothetical protein